MSTLSRRFSEGPPSPATLLLFLSIPRLVDSPATVRSSPSTELLSRRALLRGGIAVACATSLGTSRAFLLADSAQDPVREGLFDVKAFGARGLRSENATGACQAAIDACTAAGGGTVRVPPGDYSVGTIQLKDNVTLHLDAGATLFMIQDTTQFPRGRRAMVFAENAANISVTGRGSSTAWRNTSSPRCGGSIRKSRRRSRSRARPGWTCGATTASASRPTCSS